MGMDLAKKDCVPCRGGVPPLSGETVDQLLRELDGWSVEEGYHLTRTYKFKNFAEALVFVNRVGEIAEQQNHHPDLHLAWGKVRVVVWTHKISGLTESDFIFGAKVDAAFAPE